MLSCCMLMMPTAVQLFPHPFERTLPNPIASLQWIDANNTKQWNNFESFYPRSVHALSVRQREIGHEIWISTSRRKIFFCFLVFSFWKKKIWMKLLKQEKETNTQIEEKNPAEREHYDKNSSAIGKQKMIHKMPMSNCPFFFIFFFCPLQKPQKTRNTKLGKSKRFVRACRFNLTAKSKYVSIKAPNEIIKRRRPKKK